MNALSYVRVRGLYDLAVAFVATIILIPETLISMPCSLQRLLLSLSLRVTVYETYRQFNFSTISHSSSITLSAEVRILKGVI